MDPKTIKRTQDTLGKIIKKPPLTDKLLGKPPFRFLHDIMTSVIKTTGFMKGLYSDQEMNSENVKDKDAKMAFLQKSVDLVIAVTGKSLSVRPAKIVAGHEPEKTNEFLQALASAINAKVDNAEYVDKVLHKGKGGSSKTEEKRDSEKEKSRDKSSDRRHREEEKGSRDREKSRDKDKDERHRDRDERHKDREDRHRDKEKDREDRHKDREREGRHKSGRSREGPHSKQRVKSIRKVSSDEDNDKASRNPNGVFTSDSDLDTPYNTPDMALDGTFQLSRPTLSTSDELPIIDSTGERIGPTDEEIAEMEEQRRAQASRARANRPKAARPRREPMASSVNGTASEGSEITTDAEAESGSGKKRKAGIKSRLSNRKKEDIGDSSEKKTQESNTPQAKRRNESIKGPKTSTPKNSPDTPEMANKSKRVQRREKADDIVKNRSEKIKTVKLKQGSNTEDRRRQSIKREPDAQDKTVKLKKSSSKSSHKHKPNHDVEDTRGQRMSEDVGKEESTTSDKRKIVGVNREQRLHTSSFSMLSSDETQRRDEDEGKENDAPGKEMVNGDHKPDAPAPARMQRPSSAKGSRRRMEGQDSSDEDVPAVKQPEPMLGEEDLPPQVTAARKAARPSSARPAPPKRKEDVVQNEPAMRLGTGQPQNLIIDDGAGSDDDETFVVEESAPVRLSPEPTAVKPDQEDDEDHGGLVKKIMETKKEYEQPRKTEIERPTISDAQRRKQREMVQREIDKLRTSIQTLTRSANPLGKIMDYVQEDLDSMQKELEKWKSENKEHTLALKREKAVTERAVEPLKVQLTEVDQAIKDQLELIGAVKSNIIKNDQKMDKMLRTIARS